MLSVAARHLVFSLCREREEEGGREGGREASIANTIDVLMSHCDCQSVDGWLSKWCT